MNKMGLCRTRTLWNTERDRSRFWHVQQLHCKLSPCKRVDVDAKPYSQVNRKRLCVPLYTFTLTDPISVRDCNVDNRIRQPSVEQNRYFSLESFSFFFSGNVRISFDQSSICVTENVLWFMQSKQTETPTPREEWGEWVGSGKGWGLRNLSRTQKES